MTAPDVPLRRLQSSGLAGPPMRSPEEVVRRLGAVQSQDYPAARWAVAQRTDGASATDVDRLLEAGSILRTHVLRPTWHLVTPPDIRWMLRLTAPRVVAAMAPYQRGLEIDDATVERSHAALAAALQGGVRLTRAEVSRVFEQQGIEAQGLRTGHLLMRAELAGLVCSGGLRGRQHTYALLDEVVAATATLDRDAALAELTLRYFASHGPAQIHDFAWWSGLTLADARAGIEMAGSSLQSEAVDGRDFHATADAPRRPRARRPLVHLLPNYDEYLVAYRDRSRHVHTALRERIPATAVLDSSVVLDGRVIGGWRGTVGKSGVTLATRLLVTLDRGQHAALERQAQRYGRFLGMPARLVAG